MGLFDKFKKDKTVTDTNDVEAMKKRLKSISLVGEQYPCRKDKRKMRRSAEKGIKIGSKVTLERFTYNRKPAYMVVNPKNGLDIGVISTAQASWLASKTDQTIIQGEIADQYGDADAKHWKVYFEIDE